MPARKPEPPTDPQPNIDQLIREQDAAAEARALAAQRAAKVKAHKARVAADQP